MSISSKRQYVQFELPHQESCVYNTEVKYEAMWSQFTRIGQVITLHHCGRMQLILEYNDYLEQAVASTDISEGRNTSAPVAESDEEEDRPIVCRSPQKTLNKNRKLI